MENRYIGVLAGIVGILGFCIQNIPLMILDRFLNGEFEGVIPIIGTMGQTTTLYTLLVEISGLLVTLLLAIGLGYYVAQTVDMGHEYRRVIGATAAGSGASVMLVMLSFGLFFALTSPAGTTGSVSVYSVFVLIGSFMSLLVSISLVVTVGAFAGAALAHFRTRNEPLSRPAKTRSDSPSDAHSDSIPENSHA